MEGSKFIKTPKLSIVLQLTEAGATGADERVWEIHDVERNRGFRATLASRSLQETPQGRASLKRPFTETEIEGAIGLAVERTLVTPPEKVGGQLYDLSVTSQDLYDFVDIARSTGKG
ncbi:MAG: hypothetical protein JXO72_00265 [Vicinamibacteria bacterium]|nr:hypothetical protein [Vicinamibacteria bacterium]